MKFQEKLIFPTGGRSNFRIPSVITTRNGTVLAFCSDRKDTVADHMQVCSLAMVRKLPGEDWSEVIELRFKEGFVYGIGSAIYDEVTDTAMIFSDCTALCINEFGKYTEEELERMIREADERAAAAGIIQGPFILKSNDNGETWREEPYSVEGTEYTHFDGRVLKAYGGNHGSAHGITLRHGEHAGRLLCATRIGVDRYTDFEGLRYNTYNNSIYSDDHGLTWKNSTPVQLGTGEGTLIERADGSILYNSRAYFKDSKRYTAVSTDGGATYHDFGEDSFLIEETAMGCNASFIRVELDELSEADRARLPEGAQDVTVFCNPRAVTRRNMSACVSFDSGKTWSHVKTFFEGPSSYSSLAYSAATGLFYLIYEKGDGTDNNPIKAGISGVEFDLEWLLSE